MNLIERMAGAEWFLNVAPKVVPRMDSFVHRVTGGRVLPSALYMPIIMLTTTGRKSGQPREVPIAALLDGENFIVVGSNFGREHHPAWALNLEANPDATVSFKGKTFPVRAHLADAEKKAELWPRIVKRWPHFDTYVERSGGRDLRVFRLLRTS